MKDILLKILNFVILFGLFIYIGFRSAQIGGETSEEFPFVIILIAVIYMYIAFLLHVILHEAGHLLAGILTGYKFVSFRIGTFVWIKNKEGKLEFKRMKIQGTGGQCLMCPPEVETEKCPYKLYHLFGGLTNLILGTMGIILALILPQNIVTFILCEEFGVIGIALGLTNLIPCKNGGMQNDGYNLLDLGHNVTAKKCMNLVLTMNALITIADSYADLPDGLVNELKSIDFKKMDLSNSSIANAFNFQVSLLFVEGNYKEAYELQKYIIEYPDILPIFKNEAKCECLFFELINGAEREIIEKRYDEELKKYIKATSIYPARQRLMYAYYKLYEKDEKKAGEALKKLEKMIDTYVIKADAKHELEVAKKICQYKFSTET